MRRTELSLLCLAASVAAIVACAAPPPPNSFAGKSASSTEPEGDEGGEGDDGDGDETPATASPDAGRTSGSGTGGASSGDPFAAPAQCTNGKSTAGNGSRMRPGSACNDCHGFALAGTVYPTAHEPDNCKGAPGGATVLVTDANGKTYSIPVNSSGNFYAGGAPAFPLHVKVSANGALREMTTALTRTMGDCNGCHTQAGDGSPKAPGRILLPE